ncbi:DUF300-domain-containing protein [Auricularia subglabra TFB-10046 SS5]|uniref:DUF300-domain-containing protein n=1 Tax=Auricularia subglabra (strain TFB-10046 / SS5) TaxID=717982 RepID=J0WYI2_AURST|nr:DUF300-domain-containing protein [Auricularia subglabra TFB-10046 SS5]
MVIRIMVMVPIYAIASLISLVSLEAAFVIDAIRDIYEAFVIYCFFQLLIGYLGGERSLLILLHGRPPKYHVFPVTLFKQELDASDPYTFLNLKRGIMQYVQVKPLLAIATVVLKAVGKYNEGDLRPDGGYLYISIVYNVSICVSLYCLAMFWLVVNDDLKPFRPMPKFLCVKGILFFSFWQALAISILVAAGAIRSLGPYTDSEHISLALTDTLICFEMPLFAIAHMYAFSARDYEDKETQYAARMRFWFALRDACGVRDLVEDFRATLRGEGFGYRMFEPAEGAVHQGVGRERRIRAGLRYAQGGKKKYWLPMPRESLGPRGTTPALPTRDEEERVHLAPDLQQDSDEDDRLEDPLIPGGSHSNQEELEAEGLGLRFDAPEAQEEAVYAYSRGMLFGDYGYPVIDVSSERARHEMWAEEERILRHERAAAFSPVFGPASARISAAGYGAVDSSRSRPVWGSLATEPHDYFGAGPGRPSEESAVSPTQIHGPPVIDFEHDRIPDMGEGSRGSPGVRLGWARTGTPRASRPPSAVPSRPASTAFRDAAVDVVDEGYDSPSTPVLHNSKAVDLVVEDHDAEEERRTRVRRKGEPVLKANLGRVYRRVDQEPALQRRDSQEQRRRDSPREEEEGLIEAVEEVVEGVVGKVVDRQRVVSPPHEREAEERRDEPRRTPWFAPSIEEGNPWA